MRDDGSHEHRGLSFDALGMSNGTVVSVRGRTGSTGRPLGECRGWVPDIRTASGVFGYTSDDVFYLQVCLFSQICSNGGEIFQLEAGEDWECAFSEERVEELQEILLANRHPPADAKQCTQAFVG